MVAPVLPSDQPLEPRQFHLVPSGCWSDRPWRIERYHGLELEVAQRDVPHPMIATHADQPLHTEDHVLDEVQGCDPEFAPTAQPP